MSKVTVETEVGKLDEMKETFARNMKIKERIDEGYTNQEIAKEFGISTGLPEYLRHNYDDVLDKLADRITLYTNVINMFLDGYTLTEIGEKYDMSKQNVSRILKLENITRSDGGKSKIRMDSVKKIADLTAENKTLSEISEITGLDEAKIRVYAYQEGIPLISNIEMRLEEVSDKVFKLREQGMAQTAIAKRLGISQAYVSKILLGANMRVRGTRKEYAERDAKIVADYLAMDKSMSKNKRIQALVEKHGLKEMNVSRIIRNYEKKNEGKGSKVRGVRKDYKERDQKIVSDYLAMDSSLNKSQRIKALVEKHGLTDVNISRIIRTYEKNIEGEGK